MIFSFLNDGKGEQEPLQPPQQHLTQPKLQVHIIETNIRTEQIISYNMMYVVKP